MKWWCDLNTRFTFLSVDNCTGDSRKVKGGYGLTRCYQYLNPDFYFLTGQFERSHFSSPLAAVKLFFRLSITDFERANYQTHVNTAYIFTPITIFEVRICSDFETDHTSLKSSHCLLCCINRQYSDISGTWEYGYSLDKLDRFKMMLHNFIIIFC